MARKARGSTPTKPPRGDLREGTVIRVDSRMCRVDTGGEIVDCRVRGLLFRQEKRFSRPLAVGDRVRVEPRKTPPDVVVEVLPRSTYLARPRPGHRLPQIIAANVDQAVIVSSCLDPPLNLRLVDRVLVAAESGDYRSLIVLNKIDLLDSLGELEEVAGIYRALDYGVLLTSAARGDGVDDLREALRDRISIFTGMSGVGKSALLTAVQPGLALETGEVSQATGKGRHTTTHSSLLALDAGGYVVDTPGIREFGISELDAFDVGRAFVDFLPFVDACRFRRCSHEHEVGCAVKAAVEQGRIHPHRYDSYLRIIESLEEG